ncbi:nuclear pore complex protein Nup50-like [Chironomus tepperi]|uniref:nuclear pore complex protein Nup50-like n=1 Tax=Chironomus tepperi TaxID=113505 RepID=UPI00391FBD9F
MSFKRTAGSELNHDNWNEEQESEDAGEFKKASDDILQKRVKKVAKRRIGTDSDDKPASNPFGAFGGFGSSTPAASSPFSFLSKLPAVTPQTKTNGEVKSSIESNKTEKPNTEYLSKVKSLNTAFVDWIKSNIDENKGLCDLTPIFKDYEKYMKECKELKDKKAPASNTDEKETSKSTFTFGKPVSANSNSTASFVSAPDSTPSIFTSIPKSDSISPAKPAVSESKPFSFGLSPSNSITSNLSAAPSFSFGGLQKTSTAITSTPAPLFGNLTNTSSVPFSFSNVGQNTTTAATESKTNDEEAEEEPPKNEFVPVVEEDSLYSKRCKVFVKSGADYADRGIGTLFLKKVDDKVQLIVRADTNLGNILLNIIICDGLPTSRLGKNNVMIVCLPTPESKPPPIPVLVRVKTAAEADELLATLEKYKNAS